MAILQKFYSSSESALGLNFINELIVRFRHCSKWVGRQAFAFICQVSMACRESPLGTHVPCVDIGTPDEESSPGELASNLGVSGPNPLIPQETVSYLVRQSDLPRVTQPVPVFILCGLSTCCVPGILSDARDREETSSCPASTFHV